MKLSVDFHALVPRLAVPGAAFAIAIALTALVATCGHEARGGYPTDKRGRAMIEIGTCDAALASMRHEYEAEAGGFEKLLATDHAAALAYLQTHISPIVGNPLASCESARDLVRELFEAGVDDMRLREDGGRMVMHEDRLRTAKDAYLALHGALERKDTGDLTPLVDALAQALR